MTSPHIRALLAMLISVALMVIAAPVSGGQESDPGNGLANGRAKDAVIVGFEEGTPKVKRGRAAKSVDAKSARKLSPLAADTYVVKLPPGQTVEKAIAKLERQDGVEFAEPDYIVQTAETSNDDLFADLWGMHGDASTPSNEFGSGAAEAWAVGAIGDPGVYVAVVDEGINTNHEDLAANMDVARGRDFLSGDTDVYDGPSYWHGTHVAGTIGARGGNAIGVAGVNWRVKMISVKMLGPEGNSGYTSETVAALDYVTSLKDAGLNIVAINASWGYQGGPSTALYEAIQRAGDAGLLFVAAAGNEGKDIDKSQFTYYPASYDCSTTAAGTPRGWDCIISVANLTASGGIASTSNYGATSVDLGAPGSGIRSAYGDTYALSSGTSMAAPHVAGAVALCASLDPSASPATLRDRILSTATPTDSMVKTVTGSRLDIGAMSAACGAPVLVSVPDLSGPASAADGKITDAGLSIGTVGSANSETVPLDHVISQAPTAGTAVAPGTSVDYVVSLGPVLVSVPDLSGPASAADGKITDAGLSIGTVGSANSETVPLDHVISQAPTAGTAVAPGTSVDYVVSLGPVLVSVPDLSGPASAADGKITDAGLSIGTVGSANSETVPLDHVISQAPTAGTAVAPGTSVDYVVSLGPVLVSVPDLSGPASAADGKITDAGLSIGTVGSANSETVPLDHVISQAPTAGTAVAPGTSVDYVVSLGPVLVSVPDLSGPASAADGKITDAGLSIGTVGSANSETVPLDHVISQAPTAGTAVAPGTSVDYVVSLGPVLVSVPTPTPPPTVTPPAPTATTVVVDDRSRKFVRRGSGWNAARFGFNKHHFWTPTRPNRAKRVGKWKPALSAPGTYRIMAKLPAKHATTKRAVYTIKTVNGWVKRVRNQSRRQGRWLDLGVHRLSEAPVVRLSDRTGERTTIGRSVAFDAVRFVPVSQPAAAAFVTTPQVAATPAVSVEPAASPAAPVETVPRPDQQSGTATVTATTDPRPTAAPAARSSATKRLAPERASLTPKPAPKAKPESKPHSASAPKPAKSEPKTSKPRPTPKKRSEAAAEPTRTPSREPKPAPKPAKSEPKTSKPRPTPTKRSEAAAEPTRTPSREPKPAPKPAKSEPKTSKPRPTPTKRSEAAAEPKKPAPKPAKSEPKTSKPQPTPKKRSEAAAEPKKPAPKPDLVLVLEPHKLELEIGESRRVAAFACVGGAVGPGPDARFGTADDGCSQMKDVNWSLNEPGVATFVIDKTAGKGRRVALTALSPTQTTTFIANIGDLTGKGELTVRPATTRATEITGDE